MALVHLNFESQYTGHNEDVNIVLPDRPREADVNRFYESGARYQVLWLLHGSFGGYSDWIRKSNIESYAGAHDLVVVMPEVGNSEYEPWPTFASGYDSKKYIAEELMPLVHGWFPVSSRREDNFIAGLSMGGSGTIKLALAYPDKFSKAASLSSCPRELDNRREELEAMFRMSRKEAQTLDHRNYRTYNSMLRFDSVEEFLDSDANTWRNIDCKVREKAELPDLMFAIGTEDPGYADMQKFRAHAREIGLPITYYEGPGRHEWKVWERDIQIALRFFGMGEEEKGNIF